jgi:hypothetical protein
MIENSATVEVLTAEVRQLMIDKRQVTLSIFRQLDDVDPDCCQPFGRVHDSNAPTRRGSRETSLSTVHVVGRSTNFEGNWSGARIPRVGLILASGVLMIFRWLGRRRLRSCVSGSRRAMS